MTDFLIRRNDLRECRIAESDPLELGPSRALLRVDSFGLTTNNITYAVMGDAMSYWDFFPAPDGWGRVPMWGFAEVQRSEVEGLAAGTRLYGYLPPSSQLVVTPAGLDVQGFVDGAPHRAQLPSAYQRYVSSAEDPFYRENTEEIQMLLRPLFFTSFLIDDQLDDEGLVDRGPILISSASSKTAIAAAYLLAQREEAELIALTSPRSAEFVEALGIYDRTVTYDAIDSLQPSAATYVDVAGAAEVRAAVHRRFAEQLAHSMAVGVTHREELGGGQDLPGPPPTLFFAPDRVNKRSADWGASELQARVADAWHPFCEWIGGWLEIDRGHGFDAVKGAYLDVLEGRVDPASANVISLPALDDPNQLEDVT